MDHYEPLDSLGGGGKGRGVWEPGSKGEGKSMGAGRRGKKEWEVGNTKWQELGEIGKNVLQYFFNIL